MGLNLYPPFYPPKLLLISVPVEKICEIKTAGGGWLTFQRNQPRKNGGKDNPFALSHWKNYRDGFGEPNSKAFWLGLRFLNQVKNRRQTWDNGFSLKTVDKIYSCILLSVS